VISVPTPAIDVEVAGHGPGLESGRGPPPARGETKLDLVRYYLAVSEGAVRGVFERRPCPSAFPTAPSASPASRSGSDKRPDWLETVLVTFPSGCSADELCPVDAAHLVGAVNLGCLDPNPWPVRRGQSIWSISAAG
jgi:DNA primase